MNTTIKTEQTRPTHEQVAVLAYQIWKKGGCPHGHDLEYWLQAEKQLNSFLVARQKQTPETQITATNNLRRGGNVRAAA
jgi:hypothetical protein